MSTLLHNFPQYEIKLFKMQLKGDIPISIADTWCLPTSEKNHKIKKWENMIHCPNL